MSYNVYCLCDEMCNVLYVGSSVNLSNRIDQHIVDNKEFSRVFYLEYESEELMLQKEKSFICKFKPDYNRKLYSGVQPNSDEVLWLELDPNLFIDKVIYRTNRKGKNLTKDIYYQIHSEILWLRFILSKIVMVSGKPVRVEFIASDKLLYTYMKQRFDLCSQNGIEYCETRVEIAESTGLTSKTVDRFISKMCKHGFIEYSTNNVGNRAVYLKVLDTKE